MSILFNADSVKTFLNIAGSEKDDQINMLIPATVKFVEKKTGLDLDLFQLDEGIAFVVSKYVEYFMLNAGLKSYSLSRESSTYSDELPKYLLDLLEPYVVDGSNNGQGKSIKFIPLKRR